jgi:hypothetical protein
MSRKATIALLFLAFAIIAAFVVWKWVFKKSDIDVSSKKAAFEIEAAVLTREFENNEEASNTKYLGKIITVSGTVNSISNDEQNVIVYLKNEDELLGVMCSLNKSAFDADLIKTGNQVKIKGICAGYLMDVQLNKCSLEK